MERSRSVRVEVGSNPTLSANPHLQRPDGLAYLDERNLRAKPYRPRFAVKQGNSPQRATLDLGGVHHGGIPEVDSLQPRFVACSNHDRRACDPRCVDPLPGFSTGSLSQRRYRRMGMHHSANDFDVGSTIVTEPTSSTAVLHTSILS